MRPSLESTALSMRVNTGAASKVAPVVLSAVAEPVAHHRNRVGAREVLVDKPRMPGVNRVLDNQIDSGNERIVVVGVSVVVEAQRRHL